MKNLPNNTKGAVADRLVSLALTVVRTDAVTRCLLHILSRSSLEAVRRHAGRLVLVKRAAAASGRRGRVSRIGIERDGRVEEVGRLRVVHSIHRATLTNPFHPRWVRCN